MTNAIELFRKDFTERGVCVIADIVKQGKKRQIISVALATEEKQRLL